MRKNPAFLFAILIICLYSALPVTAATTATLNTDHAAGGDELTVSGRSAADAWISIKLLGPGGSILFLGGVKTDAGGCYSYAFKLPSKVSAGQALTIVAGHGSDVACANITVSVPPDNPPPWYPVTAIRLDKNSLGLPVNGPPVQLKAVLEPPYASYPYCTWKSSDNRVATVNNYGLVTPVSPGQAVITATTAEGGLTASCCVQVTAAAAGISLNKTCLTLVQNSWETLAATVIPSNASQIVVWSSNDETIARVDGQGLVTALSPGTVSITAATPDGKITTRCDVTVTQPLTLTGEETITVAGTPLTITIPQGAAGSLHITPGAALPLVEINLDSGQGRVLMQIPAGTVITGPPGWDGLLRLPVVAARPSINITAARQVNMVVVAGLESGPIIFSRPLRILIPGQADREAGYIENGKFTPITRTISADLPNVAASEIPPEGEGKINVGSDLVIWSKHLTEFVIYTPCPAGHTLNLTASPVRAGTVSGGGMFYPGSLVTVRADARTGYAFDSWSEDGLIISHNAAYSFTLMDNDRSLTANFIKIFPQYLKQPVDKTWTISFSQPVNAGELSSSGRIYVATDARGINKVAGVSIEPVKDSACRAIIKPPAAKWNYGRVYYLFIEPGLQSSAGKVLDIKTRMKFTILTRDDSVNHACTPAAEK